MSHKSNRLGFGKFKPADGNSFERKRNTREERKVKEELPKMVFSFKDFDIKQIPPGQSYGKWQEDKILAYMLQKFEHICALNIV